MDLAGFLENLSRVIVQRGALVKMYGDGVLASIHLYDGWGRPKEFYVVCEVLHTQRSRHDQQLHWHTFLQRHQKRELKWIKNEPKLIQKQ